MRLRQEKQVKRMLLAERYALKDTKLLVHLPRRAWTCLFLHQQNRKHVVSGSSRMQASGLTICIRLVGQVSYKICNAWVQTNRASESGFQNQQGREKDATVAQLSRRSHDGRTLDNET